MILIECTSLGIRKNEDADDKEDCFPDAKEWPIKKAVDVSKLAANGIPHCKGLWTKRCNKWFLVDLHWFLVLCECSVEMISVWCSNALHYLDLDWIWYDLE